MRYLVPLALLLVTQIGAAWAVGDLNIARPGGSFATVEAESATRCERLCADDTLCMAWSFHGNSCELKAIVPAAVSQEGVISGVSNRAPASMRARFQPMPPAPTADQDAEALLPLTAEAPPEDDVSLALLGGPETDDGLRAQLGN